MKHITVVIIIAMELPDGRETISGTVAEALSTIPESCDFPPEHEQRLKYTGRDGVPVSMTMARIESGQ